MPPKSYSRLWIAIAVVAGQRGHGGRAHARARSRESRNRTVRPAADDGDGQAAGLRPLGPAERDGRGGRVDDDGDAPTAGPTSQSLVITKLDQGRGAGREGRPHRRVRPPDAARDGARPARRAERPRAADQEEGRGERAAKARDDGEILLAESIAVARKARDLQERAAAEDSGGEERPRRRAGHGDAQSAEDDLRAQAQGGRGGPPDPPDPPRPRRERDAAGRDQRRADGCLAPIGGMAVLRMVWKIEQPGGGPGRRGSPRRRARRRRRQPEDDARARAGSTRPTSTSSKWARPSGSASMPIRS